VLVFVGHLAVALAVKKLEPDVPLAASVAATFGLDLIWPIFLLAGLETVRVAPGDTAFTQLAFESYPWSHSLVMAVAWGGLVVISARAILGLRPALVLGAVVVSHWVLDFVTHRPDLPLWPGGPVFGLGLWSSVPATFVVEGLVFAGAVALYLTATRSRDRVGGVALFALLLLCTLMWASSPFAPPPPSADAVAWGSLVLWLFVPWAGWIERHREVVAAA
jgi:hypothetical protein